MSTTIPDLTVIEGIDFDDVVKCGSIKRECENPATLLATGSCPSCHPPRINRPVCQSCWDRRKRGEGRCQHCAYVGDMDEFWTVRPL